MFAQYPQSWLTPEGKRKWKQMFALAQSGSYHAKMLGNRHRRERREQFELPRVTGTSRRRGQYDTLASVWNGEDAELLEELLRFYPRKVPRLILDACVNGARFWRGSARPVIGLDIEAKHRPDIVGDNASMPFPSGVFDVVVYDPPHVPNQGQDKSQDFNFRFGLGRRVAKEFQYNFSHTFPPFLAEAWRVLRTEGVLLCKIADYVHHHRYQWAHIDLVDSARVIGFRACDCIVKVRKGPIIDPKWRVAHHSRRQHSIVHNQMMV